MQRHPHMDPEFMAERRRRAEERRPAPVAPEVVELEKQKRILELRKEIKQLEEELKEFDDARKA